MVLRATRRRRRRRKEEEEESLFKADAVNEEDPERVNRVSRAHSFPLCFSRSLDIAASCARPRLHYRLLTLCPAAY